MHSHEGQVQAADWCVMFKKVSGFVSRLCSGFAAFKLAVSPRNSTPQSHDLAFFFFFYSLKQLFYLFEGCLDCWRLLFGLGHVPLYALHLSHEPFVQSERKKKKREKGFKKIRIFLHRRATVLSLSHGLVSQMQTPSWSERYYACIASLMNEFHPRHHQ